MTATQVSLVIDASTALKWYLVDETGRAPALSLFRAWESSRVDFVESSHFLLEVVNGIRKTTARRDRQLPSPAAREHVVAFLAMGITLLDVSTDLAAIYDEATRFGTTVYDMAYVHVAFRRGLDFVTGDDRLVAAVQRDRPFVKHLRDFVLPGVEPSA